MQGGAKLPPSATSQDMTLARRTSEPPFRVSFRKLRGSIWCLQLNYLFGWRRDSQTCRSPYIPLQLYNPFEALLKKTPCFRTPIASYCSCSFEQRRLSEHDIARASMFTCICDLCMYACAGCGITVFGFWVSGFRVLELLKIVSLLES